MRRELLRAFWAAHRGAVLLAYGVTLLAFLLMILLLSFEAVDYGRIWRNVGYGLALTTGVVVAWLAVAWARWAPFAQALLELTREEEAAAGTNAVGPATGLSATATATFAYAGALPAPGTPDQILAAEALQRLYSLAAAERSAHQTLHEQHRTYITLWVHQMKTPVSVLHLLTEGGGPLDQSATASVAEEATKLSAGLEQALATARLTNLVADFRIEPVDLLAQVRAAISAHKKPFIKLGLFPVVKAEGADWIIRTDPKWHRFVLDQLIGNAIKYGRQSDRPTLRCHLWREGGQIHLTIADEGPGIPPGDLPRIFEPFFTGQNGRRYPDATGMGLYLVRQVMDHLEHQIAVTSEVGKGTTVRLTYRA